MDLPRSRIGTGVAGLDKVLDGGLFGGALYLVEGDPGTGKTNLAHQCCFGAARAGQTALYLSLVAETHGDMLTNVRSFDYVDEAMIGARIRYLAALPTLLRDGLSGLLKTITTEVRSSRPAVVIIDGIESVPPESATRQALMSFLLQLKSLASLCGSTFVLLSVAQPAAPEHLLGMMADGVIALFDRKFGARRERSLEVVKFRGSRTLRGEHAMRIDCSGIAVFPRIESEYAGAMPNQRLDEMLSTGNPELDKMLAGGLPEASMACVVGPPGAGKTVLGLQFLRESTTDAPGLYFGAFESTDRLLQKAARLKMPMPGPERLHLLWYSQVERQLDALGHMLLETVRERGIKRLFIDGIDALMVSTTDPTRITRYLSALTNELRLRHVTTLMSLEPKQRGSGDMSLPLEGTSAITDVTLTLRLTDDGRQLQRSIGISKHRDSSFDNRVHRCEIRPGGIHILGPLHPRGRGAVLPA